jgi:hypothetical protein
LIGLRHLSADAGAFRDEFAKESASAGESTWAFSPFQRFPIYRCKDGRYVVIDTSMMLRRCLGWPLVYDALSGIPDSEQKSVLNQIELLAEKQTCDRIRVSLTSSSWKDRVVSETDLKAVFGGHGVKTADLAVEYPNAWLVIEVSAIRPKYQALAAHSAKHYGELIDQAVEEAKQAIATSRKLLEHAQTPTDRFRLIDSSSRMYPIVVATEGFPSNPLLHRDVRQQLEADTGNKSDSIAPVEILDLDELELLLALGENCGLSIVDLIQRKQESAFWSDSMHNYLWNHHKDQISEL